MLCHLMRPDSIRFDSIRFESGSRRGFASGVIKTTGWSGG